MCVSTSDPEPETNERYHEPVSEPVPVPFHQGDQVAKMFGGDLFRGRITAIDTHEDDDTRLLFHVVYEDGDEEDLELRECEEGVNLFKGLEIGDINEWELGGE